MAAVCINNLSKVYGNDLQALKSVSLEVEEGEIFGLLGPNGAGKSTLINIVAGITRKTSGDVQVLGYSVPEQELYSKRLLGVVPQELTADGFFTVEQVLTYQSGYYGISHNQDYLEELLAKLDLAQKRHEITRHLSGGMKRRLMVAKAMVHSPRVLILDEPTAGVDIGLTVSLWEVVRELNRSGTTVILTTHNLQEAEEICDRICIIDHGEVIEMGATESLIRKLGQTRWIEASFEQLPSNLKLPGTWTTERRGNQDVVRIHYQESEISSVLSALMNLGQIILDIKVREDRLEDVFKRLVGFA
jgi:ABC-2 type transport system ATP-binding protein